MNALNGQPVKKAAVQLARGVERGPRSAPPSVLTNAEGVFRFEGVPAGAYRLSASRTGFVRGLYLNEARAYTLTVGEGAVANLKIALTPAAVVAGKVLDQDGDPIEAATVQVLRATYADGKRSWGVIQSTNTNDLGEYRIAGVAPGRYLIGVSKRARPAVRSANVPMPPPGGMGRGGPGGFGVGPMGVGPMAGMGRGGQPVPLNDHQFVPVYFPSALDPASATTLDCKPGAELRNIDFRLRKTRVFRVSGVVKGGPPAVSSGQPRRGPGVAVSLYSNAAAGQEGQRNAAVTREGEGAFEFAGIMPGSYTLVAFELGRNTAPMFARIPVEVSGEDVTGLVAAMQPAAKVSGRIVFEGAPAPAVGRMEVHFTPMDAPGAFAGRARVNGVAFETTLDSTLERGRYKVRVQPMPEGFYLKAVRSGEQNALEPGLAVAPSGMAPIEVVLAAGAATITGTVRDGADKPLPRAVVTLAPESGSASDGYRYVVAGESGEFQIGGLRPGAYRIHAWEQLERGAHQDPEFMRPFGPAGMGLRLEVGARESVQLGAIPAAAVVMPAAEQ